MANRYQSDDRPYRGRYGYGRQEEQFQSDRGYGSERSYGQQGESWRDDDYGGQQTGWQSDTSRDYEDRFRERDFGRSDYSRGAQRRSFDTERDYARPTWGDTSTGAGSQLAAAHGEWREASREYSDYRDTWGGIGRSRSRGRSDRNEPGFLERAGDTIAHWLGDDADYGRGERGFRGRGPQNYTRSDERILENACDRLTDDWHVDASNVQVTVQNGELTLDGTVPGRDQKRRAEECVEDLSGVKHVQNNLRVQERSRWDRDGEIGSRTNPTATEA